MKRILFFLTLCCFGASLEAAGHGGRQRLRGFGDGEGSDYLAGFGGDDENPYYSMLGNRGGSAAKIKALREEIATVKDEKAALEAGSSPDKVDKIRAVDERLQTLQESLDAEICPQAKTVGTAIKQGMSRALLGRGGSMNDAFHLTVAQALAYNMLLPMKRVITRRSETLWEKAFDKIENMTKSFMGFFGLTSTIAARDIIRWQTNCEALAAAYKELRKGVESSESRSTSLQLRSMMSDDDDEADEEVIAEAVVDKAWEQKRRGDVIMLEAMLAKLQLKRAESSQDDVDVLAALDRLLSEVEGLRDQIMSANNLRDLVDADRANLMTGYFASIDSALLELGMVIAPEEFDEAAKSRRKKTTGYSGYSGYDNYSY